VLTPPYLQMMYTHILTLKLWDWTENTLHPFVFIMVIDTGVGVFSPWPPVCGLGW
jgi:hypothetical protein